MDYCMLKKRFDSIQLGNNNSDINVIITQDDKVKEILKKNIQLSNDLAWAEQQLKIKDMIIEQLLKRLKK